MGIVVVVLGIVFLAFGALPPFASFYGTGLIRQRLAAPAATLSVAAVPTWRLLGADADLIHVKTGPTTFNGWLVEDLLIDGGPVRVGHPCQLSAGVVMRNTVLEPAIRAGVEAYTATLAETVGVPGAAVADLEIALGPTTVVSGRLEAFGGLVAVPFRLAGTPDALSPREIGLRKAVVTLNGTEQSIGDVPLMTLPITPGVGVTLTRMAMSPTELRVWAMLNVADPGRFLAPAPVGSGGSLPATP
ncbi:MAG: hypothetical protein H7338_13775 [Candidatus Sericytochromatia bacterium]|nr:hypothetical protein [Candidatus Sericytochromatia bacterium]